MSDPAGRLPEVGRIVPDSADGPVADATAGQAAANIDQFIADLTARDVTVVTVTPDGEDGGRWTYRLLLTNGIGVTVRMPGCPPTHIRDDRSAAASALYINGLMWW